jgi:hypothetical protein
VFLSVLCCDRHGVQWIRQIPRARSTTYAGYSKQQLIAALMDKRKLTNFEVTTTSKCKPLCSLGAHHASSCVSPPPTPPTPPPPPPPPPAQLCVTLAFVGDDLPPHLKLGKAQLKTFLNTVRRGSVLWLQLCKARGGFRLQCCCTHVCGVEFVFFCSARRSRERPLVQAARR